MGNISPDNVCKILVLVTYKGKNRNKIFDIYYFSLNITIKRYDKIVRGYFVRGFLLYFASIYTETVIMALQQLGNFARDKLLTIRNIIFNRPFGYNPDLVVRFNLIWDYNIIKEILGIVCYFAI